MSQDFWIGAVTGGMATFLVGWFFTYVRTLVERRSLLKLTVHRAFPNEEPPECYFIRAVNHTPDRELEIKDVWFESTPAAPVLNPERPLPAPIRAGGMWETWIPMDEVPVEPEQAFKLARLRLSTGDKFKSSKTPDKDLSPGAGGIAGRPS